jgi:hypothetical protein
MSQNMTHRVTRRLMWLLRSRLPAAIFLLADVQVAAAQRRVMEPEDLFRIERIGAITWAPDWQRAAVEISAHANVLHMWGQIERWLTETMRTNAP